MNKIKEKVFNQYKSAGYIFENYIHPSAITANNVIIGEGNNIFEGVIVLENVKIGDANLIYAGVIVSQKCELGNFNSLSVGIRIVMLFENCEQLLHLGKINCS